MPRNWPTSSIVWHSRSLSWNILRMPGAVAERERETKREGEREREGERGRERGREKQRGRVRERERDQVAARPTEVHRGSHPTSKCIRESDHTHSLTNIHRGKCQPL